MGTDLPLTRHVVLSLLLENLSEHSLVRSDSSIRSPSRCPLSPSLIPQSLGAIARPIRQFDHVALSLSSHSSAFGSDPSSDSSIRSRSPVSLLLSLISLWERSFVRLVNSFSLSSVSPSLTHQSLGVLVRFVNSFSETAVLGIGLKLLKNVTSSLGECALSLSASLSQISQSLGACPRLFVLDLLSPPRTQHFLLQFNSSGR